MMMRSKSSEQCIESQIKSIQKRKRDERVNPLSTSNISISNDHNDTNHVDSSSSSKKIPILKSCVTVLGDACHPMSMFKGIFLFSW